MYVYQSNRTNRVDFMMNNRPIIIKDYLSI